MLPKKRNPQVISKTLYDGAFRAQDHYFYILPAAKTSYRIKIT